MARKSAEAAVASQPLPVEPGGGAAAEAAASNVARDPLLWLVVAAFLVVSVPYLLPLADPPAAAELEESYGLILVLLADIVAVLWGIRPLRGTPERRFWGLVAGALALNLVVRLIYLVSSFQDTAGWGLLVDLIYLGFYVCLILAARLRPDRKDSFTGGPAEKVEAIATGVFLAGLLAYLVIVPEQVSPGNRASWVSSLVLYSTLDAYLVLGYVYLHQTSSSAHWRVVYGWMALVATWWLFTDVYENLFYLEVVDDIAPMSPVNAVWYVPYLLLGLAARFRDADWPPWLARLGRTPTEAVRPGGRMGIVVLYAVVLPALHFSLNLLDVLDRASQDAREATVMVFLPILLGLAFIHQRFLERKAHQLEEARSTLEKQQALLTAAVEQSVDSVMVVDLEGRVAYANHAWERLGGAVEGERVGRSVREVLGEVGEEADAVINRAVSGTAGIAHISRTAPDGTVREEDLLVSPVLNATGELTHHTLFIRDVTNESRLERQLQQAQRMEALGTLAGGIAHDFNNMLAAILGYSELMLDRVRHDPSLASDLGEIIRAADRAKRLTAQILMFSRQKEAERRPVFLGDVVEDVMRLVRPTIPSSLHVETRVSRGVGKLLADENRLHQVVLNLVGNAVQAAGEKGSITVAVHEEYQDWSTVTGRFTSALPPGHYAVLTVRDDGPGIDLETQARMYDPFFTTRKLGHGTGLGLSVVHGVVSAHDGGILVESEVGQGTTFRIYLPVRALPEVAEEQEGDSAPAPSEQVHLLLVDDEEMLADVLSRGLRSAGFRITMVTDSRDALDEFRAAPSSFDGLVTDQTMPGLTGMELAAAVHKVRSDLPVIMLTGYSDSVTPERMAAAGVAEILYKPVSRNELVAAIRRHLEGRVAPDT